MNKSELDIIYYTLNKLIEVCEIGSETSKCMQILMCFLLLLGFFLLHLTRKQHFPYNK